MYQRSRGFSSRIYVLIRRFAFFSLLLLLHFHVLPAKGAITLVQHASKDAGTKTTASVNFAKSNIAGNWIAVSVRGSQSSSQVFTVRDSNGNTYQKGPQVGFTGSAVTLAIYYAENIKGGANTVTVSMTVSGQLRFAIAEYSGVAISNSLDSFAAATSTSSSPNTGNLTTTANGELLLGAIGTTNSATFTAGAGYTIRDSVPELITEDQVQAAAGVTSAGATLSASDSWGAVLIAAKAAGAASVVPNITGLSPASGPLGTSVTIIGKNFGASQGTSTVTFNGTAATPTNWSATSITVPVPSGATTGNVVVAVGPWVSNGVAFTVTVPPSITSLSPTFAPLGASVTITGTNFGASQGASTVTFNGTTATPTSWSATSIVVPVPSGATTGNVVVTVAGLASNGVPFSVAPSITSLSPTSGPMGTSVTITGTSFGATQGTSTVTFGAYTATPTSWSNTTIVAPVPAGATTGNVIVLVNGIGSNRVLFTVTPSITSLSPTSGPVGTSVTITGTSFGASQGTSTVTFNGTTASPTSWSATSIVVPVPSSATTGNVVETVGGLASNGLPFTVIVPPSITSLSPTTGPVGTSVTITGANFGGSQGSSTVTFNGTAATPTSWSATSIVVPLPSGATTGNVVVTVSGLASNGVPFTVLVPPSITSLSPTSGPAGTSVTITGTNFGASQGDSTVTFNGTAATPASWSSTGIVVPVPVGATTGNVIVTVSGLASNGAAFTVVPTPSITGLNPTSGPLGTSVTITGTNFGASQGTSTVTFNGINAGSTSWSNTSITTVVPDGARSGNVVVTVAGAPSNGVNFTVTAPVINLLSPNSGGFMTPVTIGGTGFGFSQSSSTVSFAGALGTPTSWNMTSITVPVPTGATSGNVVVTVGGLPSNGVNFTVLPISVSVSPSSVTVITNQSVSDAATVQGDTANVGVTWSLTGAGCSGSACGTLGPATSNHTTAYTAPPTVPNPSTVTITATSVADPTKSATSIVTIVPPAPNITGLSPASGPVNTVVTITGTGFGASQLTSTVTFNGTSASPTGWGDSSIVVPVPNGASTGNVVVAVSSASTSNGVLFTVTPSISGLNPISGDPGTLITISGSNFGSTQGSSTVTFNGALATPTSWGNTSIVAPVPSGTTTGNIVVTVGGFASNGVSFTVAPDTTPPTAPSNLTATASSAGEIDLYWTASTDNVGVSSYQVERCQGAGCTNFTLFTTLPGPNVSTSLSDVSVVGSTGYSYRVRATDAAGNLSGYSNTVSATTPGAPTITSLNPASGLVGTSVTITGTGFGPGQTNSTVTFNGTAVFPATSWSDTSIVVPVPNGATTGNVVVTVGSLPSNGVNFTVTPPPPTPSTRALSPSSAVVGGGPLTLTVTGANFLSSSTVQWNGNALATTFLSSTQLQATITSANIANIGAAKVTVSNASVGGGVSNSSTFFVGTAGGSNFATIVVNQSAQDIVYDSKNQVFYLSVPGTASANPNTIAVLDPTYAGITSTQPASNNPDVLAISDDSQFLYVGIDGASTVQRFIVPGLAPDISYPLGSSQFNGPYFALDLQVAPGAPHTSAVALGVSNGSPRAIGGVTIFDDAMPRPTKTPGYGGTGLLFDSLQWGADANTLFASNTETTGHDFYTLAVNSNGVALNQDFPGTFTQFGDSIHFDPATKLIYSDEGHAINPVTGLPAANFNATGVVAVDAALNTAFFASLNSSSIATIQSFDLTHFTPINTVTIPNVTGTPLHLIRWGQNGLALISKAANGTSQVVLLGGDFVSAAPPFVATPPPAPAVPPATAPNAPTITSLNPSSAIAGSAAFVLNVTGTQFDPSATVQFNGSALSTTYVSSTQLQALIPASDLASPGTSSIVVANPSANGGNSSSSTFFVGSAGGSSSSGAGFAFQIVNQVSNQIAFDPASQRIYLSVPNSAARGNTIAVLEPATATIVGQQYAGSNPNVLALSGDGQFLYAGLDGSSSVQRFILPGLGTDISYSLGADPNDGPYFALDLQAAPGSPHTTAVARGAWNTSPAAVGGVEIFDDTVLRPTVAPWLGSGGIADYGSLQWGSDATALFAANNENTGFDFYTLSVNSSGVSLTNDFRNTFSSFRNEIHFDQGTKLVYSDDGHVVAPSTGASAGTFPITGLLSPVIVPDSSLSLAFFASQTGSSSVGIYSFNLSTFAPVSSITIPNVNGNPIRLIRWGQNGLAFNTDAGQIVLVGGNFVH